MLLSFLNAVFKDDKDVLDRLAKIKLDNKKKFAKYIAKNQLRRYSQH